MFFFFSSRRRHTRFDCDWSSDVCSSDLCAIGSPGKARSRRRTWTCFTRPTPRAKRSPSSDRPASVAPGSSRPSTETRDAMTTRKELLRGPRIDPRPITGRETVPELVDNAFLAYNAGRLAEGCRLFSEQMLEDDVTVGMSLTGAMTPAGPGVAPLHPPLAAGVSELDGP